MPKENYHKLLPVKYFFDYFLKVVEKVVLETLVIIYSEPPVKGAISRGVSPPIFYIPPPSFTGSQNNQVDKSVMPNSIFLPKHLELIELIHIFAPEYGVNWLQDIWKIEKRYASSCNLKSAKFQNVHKMA
jgi:hypothetical protein